MITVMPGFFRTKMTENMTLPEKLMGDQGVVADDIFKDLKKNRPVIYTLCYWKWIMLVIRMLPDRLFMRMGL